MSHTSVVGFDEGASPDGKRKKSRRERVGVEVDLIPLINESVPNKVISFFTHKGGVGKTTCMINIAEKMIELKEQKEIYFDHRKKPICLIDLDPQMSLTTSIIGVDNVETHLTELESEQLKNRPEESSCDNMFSVYMKLSDKKTNFKYYSWSPDIDLIKGSFELSTWSSHVTTELIRWEYGNNLKLVKEMLDSIKLTHSIILLDLNPSLYGLNKAFLMFSDYICSPVLPDIFGRMHFKLLKRNFYDDLKNAPQYEKFKPKLCGYIANKVEIRTGKIANDVQRGLEDIEEVISECNMSCPRLGFIEDLRATASRMHNQNSTFMSFQPNSKFEVTKKREMLRELDAITRKFLNSIQ